MVKENKHLAVLWSFQTARSKVQHRRDLFAGQVEPFDDLFYTGSRFEILENHSDRHPCTTEDPRPLTFPGMLSTARHCDQSSAAITSSFEPSYTRQGNG